MFARPRKLHLNRLRHAKPCLAERHHHTGMAIISEAGGEAAESAVHGCVAVGAHDDGARTHKAIADADMMDVAAATVKKVSSMPVGKIAVLFQNIGPLLA